MPRGPLPNPQRRRRNAPTIQSTVLPAHGRKGRAPTAPYPLGKAGGRWWKWAWSTPQAARWDAGVLYAVARRALLEDDLAALEFKDEVFLEDLLGGADPDAIKAVEFAIDRLRSVATGSVTLMKEMRELDKRLGLDPKALAELRWVIGDEEDEDGEKVGAPSPVRRLRAVDAA